MALIQCSECKTEVSDNAKACPKCGQPLNPRGTSHFKTGLKFGLVIGLVSSILFGILLSFGHAVVLTIMIAFLGGFVCLLFIKAKGMLGFWTGSGAILIVFCALAFGSLMLFKGREDNMVKEVEAEQLEMAVTYKKLPAGNVEDLGNFTAKFTDSHRGVAHFAIAYDKSNPETQKEIDSKKDQIKEIIQKVFESQSSSGIENRYGKIENETTVKINEILPKGKIITVVLAHVNVF